MKRLALLVLVLAACTKGTGDPPSGTAAAALTGTIAGAPFAPTVVLLLDSSDGGKLVFHQLAPDRRDRPRARCVEPMPAPGARTLSKRLSIAEWKVGTRIAMQVDAWGVSDVSPGEKHPGTVLVRLTAKDPATLRVAGTIDFATDDGTWQLAGEFEGEYCPTKVVPRGDDAALAGMPWAKDPIDPETIVTTPAQAAFAGMAAPIAHATWREVTRDDGGEGRRQELMLFAQAPADPCAVRPMGDADPRIDTIGVWSVPAPVAGARLTGKFGTGGSTIDQVDQIVAAEVHVFDSDGARHWLYAQYFSAALALDTVDDKQVAGRVFIALPDQGKSMAVGAFTAVRCPPLPVP